MKTFQSRIVRIDQMGIHKIEHVLQCRLIQKKRNVRAIVMRGHHERNVGVNPQRVRCIASDGNDLATTFAKLTAELRQLAVLPCSDTHEHVASARHRHARDDQAGSTCCNDDPQ